MYAYFRDVTKRSQDSESRHYGGNSWNFGVNRLKENSWLRVSLKNTANKIVAGGKYQLAH